jgi:hypothetical protein
MKSGYRAGGHFSRHNRLMGRAPLNSPESVRHAVQQLLDAAGTGVPVTPLLFRRLVSSRRVREQLGGGDPAWIGRQIRAIEAEVISQSTARFTATGLPEPVADSMRALWLMALEAARGELTDAQAAAAEAVVRAAAERDNSAALTAMLRTELDDWQRHARDRDMRIGQQEAELAESRRQLAEEKNRARLAETRLLEVTRAHDEARRQYDEAQAAVQREYAGLARQLMNATDEQRRALAAAQAALQPELKSLRQRLAQMTAKYEQLDRARGDPAATPAPGGGRPAGTRDHPAG